LPSIGSYYWRLRFPAWPRLTGRLEEGYTVLVPVPGDLPAFAELALSVLRKQTAGYRVATFVIPDQPSSAIRQLVRRARPTWPDELTLVALPPPELWFAHKLRSVSRIHWLQVTAGLGKVHSTHAVLHDADLFLFDPCVLDDQYVLARDRGLSCLGVSPVWDGWYKASGRDLVATWEMLASVDWFRSFSPAQHGPHDGEIWGERHTFDTTLYPQAVTEQRLIARTSIGDKIAHFNYVVSTYRHFQRSRGRFPDHNFRLLLISTLLELFGTTCEVPPLAALAQCLAPRGSSTSRIEFPTSEAGSMSYARFRTDLSAVLSSPFAPAPERARATRLLKPFDDHYQWAQVGARTAEQTSDWAAEGNSGTDPITTSWEGDAEYQVVANLPWADLQAIDPPQ